MGSETIRFISYALLIFNAQKSLFLLSLLLLTSLILAWFLGQTAVIEAPETSLVLMKETARIFCVFSPSFLLSAFLLDFQKRGEMQVWLTKGVSRSQFIWKNMTLGISLITFFVLLSTFFLGIFLQKFSVIWALFLFLESAVLLSITLFLSLNLRSLLKVQALLMAFYFLGRFKGLFIKSLEAPWLDYNSLSPLMCKILLVPIPDFSVFNTLPDPLTDSVLNILLSQALFLAMTHWSFRKKCL